MDKESFLKESITDIQGTIRAIDTKLIGLLVVVLIPIGKLKEAYSIFHLLIENLTWLGGIILLLFAFFWSCSFLLSILGLVGISNPSDKISEKSGVTGIFYSGDLYSINFFNLFFSKSVKSTKSLDQRIQDINDSDIIKELTFEQMKVSFIRDIKIKRQKSAIICTSLALLIFLGVWLYSIHIVNQ